jgi:hypothetical protein
MTSDHVPRLDHRARFLVVLARRAALRGWKFVHRGEIAFDYRVRTGSMLSDTLRRQQELHRGGEEENVYFREAGP